MQLSSYLWRGIIAAALMTTTWPLAAADEAAPPAHRVKLYKEWKQLPEPPITPYDGPFGGEARAFIGKLAAAKPPKALTAAYWDWTHAGDKGVYDPKQDPRAINAPFEAAVLDDWDRMGYNCSYKGAYWTYRVGAFLKEKGLLGAIDQTLWGARGAPPLQFDAKEGRRHREACGSFFAPENYAAGVKAIAGMGHVYKDHLFTVGDHKITCSWDEVGLRTRAQMDYRDPMRDEFRKFLKDIWFGDRSPNQDTNEDGRTYNAFTGEKLTSWGQVEPVELSLDWSQPAWSKGGRSFSKMPEVDGVMFEQPGRYKLLIDFHRYYTFEFFRRINEEASQKMNAMGTPGRVSCYPFTQHFIIWPGANQRHGNSFYWYHRLSPVVNVEHCWSEAPVMNLNYAITDRLAPRHKNLVMGWIWFYFGQEGFDMYNGPHDMGRAMARMMGHVVDGTHHWLYSPRYRSRDRKQRLQIAYWQNFLKSQYANFLSKSAPPQPQVALLMPDTTGYFYRYFQYPKQDFGWTAEALQNLQLSYHIITEEELELGEADLTDYKVLYVVGSEWSTPTIRRRIVDFIGQGGVAFANVDSLTLDIATGKRTDFLEKTFGAKIERKHKNAFFPSTQTAEEAVWAVQFDTWGNPFKLQGHMVHLLDDPRAWAKLYARTGQKFVMGEDGKPKRQIPDHNGMRGGRPRRDPSWQMTRDKNGKLTRDEAVWKQLDEAMATMPKEVLGIKQSPLDMRTPPQVKYPGGAVAANWSEIDEATAVNGAKPIAWWGDKVVGIEGERTVWLGTREGMNLHAISTRMSAHRGTEPCNPFPSEIPEMYESHRPYAEALGYAAKKAGVTRVATLTLAGKLPMNLEVLPRVDANGTLMVIAISHDKTEAVYDVAVDPAYVKPGAEAWDMLNEKTVESKTDGQFKLKVPSWGVSVVMLGTPANLKPIKASQAKLNRKDMTVSQYFRDRPELNTGEWNTPVPAN